LPAGFVDSHRVGAACEIVDGVGERKRVVDRVPVTEFVPSAEVGNPTECGDRDRVGELLGACAAGDSLAEFLVNLVGVTR
jgi:hypothetical protein